MEKGQWRSIIAIFLWNEHNTPCKILNYEYIGNASLSVNESTIQKELEITESSRFDIEPNDTLKSSKNKLKSVRENQFGYDSNNFNKCISSLRKNKKDKLVNGVQQFQKDNKLNSKTSENNNNSMLNDSNVIKKAFHPTFLKNDNNSLLMYNAFSISSNIINKTKSNFFLRSRHHKNSSLDIKQKEIRSFSSIILPPNGFSIENSYKSNNISVLY